MILEARKLLQMEARILPCPDNRKIKKLKKIPAQEEGNIIFDLTPTPIFLMNTDTSQTCKLTFQRSLGPNDDF